MSRICHAYEVVVYLDTDIIVFNVTLNHKRGKGNDQKRKIYTCNVTSSNSCSLLSIPEFTVEPFEINLT